MDTKPAQSPEVTEAIKVRKRIRMRKALTKANSMLAEAELMENMGHTDDDKERLRAVTSTIFGARAASEIPLSKSKSKQKEGSSGGHKHLKRFGPYTVVIFRQFDIFNSYDEDIMVKSMRVNSYQQQMYKTLICWKMLGYVC